MKQLAVDRFLAVLPGFETEDFTALLSVLYDDVDVEEAAPELKAALIAKVHEDAATLSKDTDFLDDCLHYPQFMKTVLQEMFQARAQEREKMLSVECEAFRRALNDVYPCPCGMRCNLGYHEYDSTVRCFCGKVVKRRDVDDGSPIVAVARVSRRGVRGSKLGPRNAGLKTTLECCAPSRHKRMKTKRLQTWS